jgi:hypothetical protein
MPPQVAGHPKNRKIQKKIPGNVSKLVGPWDEHQVETVQYPRPDRIHLTRKVHHFNVNRCGLSFVVTNTEGEAQVVEIVVQRGRSYVVMQTFAVVSDHMTSVAGTELQPIAEVAAQTQKLTQQPFSLLIIATIDTSASLPHQRFFDLPKYRPDSFTDLAQQPIPRSPNCVRSGINPVAPHSVVTVHHHVKRHGCRHDRRKRGAGRDHEHDYHLQFRCLFNGGATQESTSHHAGNRNQANDAIQKKGQSA